MKKEEERKKERKKEKKEGRVTSDTKVQTTTSVGINRAWTCLDCFTQDLGCL